MPEGLKWRVNESDKVELRSRRILVLLVAHDGMESKFTAALSPSCLI
jgi:hypothetical protein